MKEVIVKMVFAIVVISVRYFIYVVSFYELYIEKRTIVFVWKFYKTSWKNIIISCVCIVLWVQKQREWIAWLLKIKYLL